jgi:hypothetical protein
VESYAADNAADIRKQQAAARRKRQLLAELERGRIVRHAAGDTRETYILCPRAPEPDTEPERTCGLAADRQCHSAVIHADRAVPSAVIHAQFALTDC